MSRIYISENDMEEAIDNINIMIDETYEEIAELEAESDSISGFSGGSYSQAEGENNFYISSYKSDIFAYEEIRDSLQSFLDDIDNSAGFIRNTDFIYDEHLKAEIELNAADYAGTYREVNKFAAEGYTIAERPADVPQYNILHQGSEIEVLIDQNDATMNRLASQFLDENRSITTLLNDINLAYDFFYTDLNVNDYITNKHESAYITPDEYVAKYHFGVGVGSVIGAIVIGGVPAWVGWKSLSTITKTLISLDIGASMSLRELIINVNNDASEKEIWVDLGTGIPLYPGKKAIASPIDYVINEQPLSEDISEFINFAKSLHKEKWWL